MKFFIYMLFIGLLIDPVISQASSNICPNLNGLYKDGAETECYRYQGQDGAVHIYFCQNYKIVSQSGCEKIALFEKNVVVNPDSLFDSHRNDVERLKISSFTVGLHEFPINNPSWYPTGSCNSGAVAKTKSHAEATGYLVTLFSCYHQDFTQTRMSLENSVLKLEQRWAKGHLDPSVPGPWNPWSLKLNLQKVQEFPRSIWRPYSAGQFIGDFTLDYRQIFDSPDWNILIYNTYVDSNSWIIPNSDQIQKTLNSLDKTQKYICSLRAMTKSDYPYVQTLLVESLENCRAVSHQ